MKKPFLLSLLFLLSINISFAQSQTTKAIGTKRVLYNESSATVQNTSKPAIESQYYGYDNEIKKISLSNSIPSTFPTKEGFSTKGEYKIAINKWIKENPSFTKPEFKNTVIND